jgi:hypothetical protein
MVREKGVNTQSQRYRYFLKNGWKMLDSTPVTSVPDPVDPQSVGLLDPDL